jgi:hemolysin III
MEKRYSRREDIANAVSHGIGLMLSVAGLVVLAIIAIRRGTALHIVSCGVYGVSLVLLFAASTLYHSFQSPRIKHVFRIIDHSSIYVLIAGTYTPFTLVVFRGALGWTLFGLVWGLSVLGVVFQIFFVNRFKIFSVLVYLLMGWLVVIATHRVLATIPLGGILWLVAGGLTYTTGVLFYAWKKIPYNHAIWHLFVLVGSACHYFAVLFYVFPKA